MAIRVAINGFGRIGRLVFRIMSKRPDTFDVVAIHDLADAASLAYLLKYDTPFGRFDGTVEVKDLGIMVVNGRPVRVLSDKVGPSQLPWKELGIDFVVEATGVFRSRAQVDDSGKVVKDGYDGHVRAGARKVLLTVPSKDEVDATVVLGVNDGHLKASSVCISNASCTTNCLAPVAKVLDDSFGVLQGLMTTVHAYTNDQVVCDQIHKDLRRGRAAALNIIPTTTGAAKAVGKVITELNGKLNGFALRVPTVTGSLVDLTVNLAKDVSVQEINEAVRKAAEGPMKGILRYTEDEIVSSDIVGDPHSCVFDAKSTMKIGTSLYKIITWYDNEWGYSNRVVDLIEKAMRL